MERFMETRADGTARRTGLGGERALYLSLAIAFLAAVLLGFSRTFFLRPWFPERHVPPEPFFIFHGAVFTTWFVLLVLQSSLVAGGRVRWHRRVGAAGVGVAAAVFLLGIYGAMIAAARPDGFVDTSTPPDVFLVSPIADIVNFALFATLAFVRRRDLQAHKRLLLLASLSMLTAAIGRWPGLETAGVWIYDGITDLFLLPLVIWDLRSRGSLHPATLWGSLWLAVSQALRWKFAHTALWLGIADGAIAAFR